MMVLTKMKSLKIIIVSIFLSSAFVFGHTSAPADSLLLGKQYEIIGVEGSKALGVSIGADSLDILIRTPTKIITVSRNQIKSIRITQKTFYESNELYDVILTSGEKIKDCGIISIISDTVILKRDSKELTIYVDKIYRIINKQENYMFLSILGGAASGAIIGTLLGSSFDNPNGLGPTMIGTFTGFLLEH